MTDQRQIRLRLMMLFSSAGLILLSGDCFDARAQSTATETPATSEAMVAPLVRTKPKPVALKADIKPPEAKPKVTPLAKGANVNGKAAAKSQTPKLAPTVSSAASAKGLKSSAAVAPNGLTCAAGLIYDAKLAKCVKTASTGSPAKASPPPTQKQPPATARSAIAPAQ